MAKVYETASNSEADIVVVNYGGNLIKLSFEKISDEVDINSLMKLDLNNLIGEIITAPVITNKWGNILAQTQKEFSKKKLDFEIWCAKTKSEIRDSSTAVKKMTIDEVETSLLLNDEYLKKKTQLIEAESAVDIVNSIFWSLKDKSNKLDKLSLTITKDDIHNMKTSVVNGVKIVIKKRVVEED
jgi:hypothetical protein